MDIDDFLDDADSFIRNIHKDRRDLEVILVGRLHSAKIDRLVFNFKVLK